MRSILLIGIALVAAIGRAPTAEAQSTAQIVQAFAGISQGNGTLPCANPAGANGCYGVPNGAVVVQPYHFIPPNQQEYYYAVFQTGNWSGTLSVTFQIAEKGVVIQTVTAPAISVGTNSVALVSMPQSIPDNAGYVGPAKLTAITTATPTGGGLPVTLMSSAALEIVRAGDGPSSNARAPGLLQVMAGVSVAGSSGGGFPCGTGQGSYCFAVPPGAVVVQPYQIMALPESAPLAYYAAFQAENWEGTVGALFQLKEAGTTVQTGGPGGTIVPLTTWLFGMSNSPPVNGYVGPVTVDITATAIAVQRGSNMTLHGSTALQIVAAP
jgi:hypothetical protein